MDGMEAMAMGTKAFDWRRKPNVTILIMKPISEMPPPNPSFHRARIRPAPAITHGNKICGYFIISLINVNNDANGDAPPFNSSIYSPDVRYRSNATRSVPLILAVQRRTLYGLSLFIISPE